MSSAASKASSPAARSMMGGWIWPRRLRWGGREQASNLRSHRAKSRCPSALRCPAGCLDFARHERISRVGPMTVRVRVIPCLDVADGRVVKGVNFVDLRDAGDPVEAARAYDAAGADELCFLDISASHQGRGTLLDMVARTAEVCFMRSEAQTSELQS